MPTRSLIALACIFLAAIPAAAQLPRGRPLPRPEIMRPLEPLDMQPVLGGEVAREWVAVFTQANGEAYFFNPNETRIAVYSYCDPSIVMLDGPVPVQPHGWSEHRALNAGRRCRYVSDAPFLVMVHDNAPAQLGFRVR